VARFTTVSTAVPGTYTGKYFFADYCGDWVNVFDPATGNAATFATGIAAPVDLQVGPDGSLYYLARGGGANTGVVFKVDYTANQAPVITQDPSNRTVSEGASASFSVVAFGSPTLAYQWQGTASTLRVRPGPTYTLQSAAASDNGARFRCVVTNSFGSDTSTEATLTVTSNTPPTGTITSPASGALYSAGGTITYAGTGTDAQDGNSRQIVSLGASISITTMALSTFIRSSPIPPAARAALLSSRPAARHRPTSFIASG
jgi:hypothetical protein